MYGVKSKLLKSKEEEDYHKPKRESSFYSNNYIEYKSNGDRNNNLSVKEYLGKIKPSLKDIIIDLQVSNTWKVQLKIAIQFISSKRCRRRACNPLKVR